MQSCLSLLHLGERSCNSVNAIKDVSASSPSAWKGVLME